MLSGPLPKESPKMSENTTPLSPSSSSTNSVYEKLQIFPNPDGTFTRNPFTFFPNSQATEDPNNPTSVLSKDIHINQSKNTWARIYLPRKALDHGPSPSATHKLPLIVYIHGGGFALLSVSSGINHDFCTNMALHLPAVVVSIGYRLAPEHRLPAAYDDAVEALNWVKMSEEVWLRHHVDYSRCFVMGSSAGGNIAYHVCLRAVESVGDLEALKIKGLILHQPFFGGIRRTESELRLENNLNLPLNLTDLLWELSLPIGVDRDHEYSNPTVGDRSKLMDHFKLVGWKVLVTGWDGDPLIDRQIELVKLMEKRGLMVEGRFGEGGYHGVELKEVPKLNALLEAIKRFIESP